MILLTDHLTSIAEVVDPKEVTDIILLLSREFNTVYTPHNMAIIDVSH